MAMVIVLGIGIGLPILVGLLLLKTQLGSQPPKNSGSPYIGL
jgi:hypothetical protein